MGLFRHPHLTRGIVHTSTGSFAINRGIVAISDHLGESLGWIRVMADDPASGSERGAPDSSSPQRQAGPGWSDARSASRDA